MDRLADVQIEEYEEAFRMYDKDGSGFVSSKELNPVMRTLGFNPTEEDLQEMINEVDYDGNGLLDFREFVELMENQKKPDEQEDDLVNAFRVFDPDNKGYIESAELRDLLIDMERKIPEQELHHLLQTSGLDQNRRIEFKEFVHLVDPIYAGKRRERMKEDEEEELEGEML